MLIPRRALPALVAAALVAGACGGDPVATANPSDAASPTPAPTPAPTEIAFAPAAFPDAGSACDTPGYEGLLGRIEAVDARTVVFTLCAPDGAFRARLAHPSLGVLDATTIARLESGAPAAAALPGTGAYRIDRWVAGDNVLLQRTAAKASDDAVPPTIVVRWDADPAARLAELTDVTVDGIDAPGPAELDQVATLPELAAATRPGLATAFLAFGSGPAFAGTRVRRAFAEAFDRAALVAQAFPDGSAVPTHVTPCLVPGACGGKPWYDFNAPAAAAILASAGFDSKATYDIHVPDAAVPGLPDPKGAADAVSAQLAANLGISTRVDVMALDAFRTAVDAGRLDGLYLDGIASPLADATGFLAPLFGDGVRTTPARRATGVAATIAEAAAATDPEARATSIAKANAAIRNSAVVVPLAHPGSVAVFRSDVTGVATSPLGADPLGMATPGDRPQLVFLQATEPSGAWCGDQPSADAYRLCGLTQEGLYGFDGASLEASVRLARCDPSPDATTWTCRLRGDRTFADGMTVDAGDVLASFRAQWDATGPLRSRAGAGAFAAWDALFGGAFDPGG